VRSAARSPRHPNPIGISVVRLEAVTGPVLEITGLDLLDGTPVLDIVSSRNGITSTPPGWPRCRCVMRCRHGS
jgi:tRNA (Thr-GGU) A37 N-methylase